jgi:hypothetical protein
VHSLGKHRQQLASCATLWRLFPTHDREHELSFLLLFVFSLRKAKKKELGMEEKVNGERYAQVTQLQLVSERRREKKIERGYRGCFMETRKCRKKSYRCRTSRILEWSPPDSVFLAILRMTQQ